MESEQAPSGAKILESSNWRRTLKVFVLRLAIVLAFLALLLAALNNWTTSPNIIQVYPSPDGKYQAQLRIPSDYAQNNGDWYWTLRVVRGGDDASTPPMNCGSWYSLNPLIMWAGESYFNDLMWTSDGKNILFIWKTEAGPGKERYGAAAYHFDITRNRLSEVEDNGAATMKLVRQLAHTPDINQRKLIWHILNEP